MHYHLQNLQLTVQLARALAIHPFLCCMGRKIPLSFDHVVANPSDSTMQPVTARSSINTAQNSTTQLYTTNAAELAKKKIKLHSKCKKKIQKP